ncbi:DNA-processing protein DprA [Devosia sp. MC521]|uniref:DNA-processing protein DprA n=1 Tax=Devosia sp. MC521 TaxID=2759954 RepID=UPI0015F87C12|nr:DNA-processing protein DprA [Devosia sp. MC521]MBJ6986207.1 DNA-protecting protein DprA [Devosia sp. MC521]QMW64308.1 DNA-protecting protein DprA [Devosia sp. MC521]
MTWRREGDRNPSPAQRLAILRLIRTDNIGPITFLQLLSRFGSAEAALKALPQIAKRAGRPMVACTLARAEDEFADIERLRARLVIEGDSDYPNLLSHIGGAPPVLTVHGGEKLNWQRTAGIVGARNASSAGIKMTRLLTEGLGQAGFTVVSGLARGIDAAAHWAALETGTVGVLAGGLDRIYPREHLQLAEKIVDGGGALVSEMPMGWEPRAQDFPRRNRLVSGLSLGVVVVEAAKRSGSLITARLALEQNRDVFAVPGSPLDPRAEGGNLLIQQGARLVSCAQDIVEVLQDFDPVRTALFEPEWHPDFTGVDDVEPGEDVRARLRQALSVVPTPVDDILAQIEVSPAALQMLLLELDIAGEIEWSSGQLVALRFM